MFEIRVLWCGVVSVGWAVGGGGFQTASWAGWGMFVIYMEQHGFANV
ncbi:hypothetical protein [Neisseria zalophi]|nr:hypothetical protein [Neisseria zalophi]